MGVSDRIREVAERKSLSLKDLASETDTSYRTVQNYVSGERGVGSEFLSALSERLGVSASWVLTGKPPIFLQDEHSNVHLSGQQSVSTKPTISAAAPDFISIPRFAVDAAAGPGALVDTETQTGFYAFNRAWLARRHLDPKSLAVISVRGDSMEPRLSDGDLILVDRAQQQISDGIAYVLRLGSDLLVKYVQRIGPGAISILSANTLYPPREIDIAALDGELEIIGRVIASMHEW